MLKLTGNFWLDIFVFSVMSLIFEACFAKFKNIDEITNATPKMQLIMFVGYFIYWLIILLFLEWLIP